MIKKIPEHYYVSFGIDEKDIPDTTKYYFNLLKHKYGYAIRISDFPLLLAETYGREFELFDPMTWNSGEFMSYLMDLQIKFMKEKKEIDLAQLHRDILKVYDWTREEKNLFLTDSVEERMWSIFLSISDPGHNDYKIK